MLRFLLAILITLAVLAFAVYVNDSGERKPAPWHLSTSEVRQ